MERRPHGANGDSMSRRICEETTEKLGTSNKCNGRSSEEDEEAVRQEKEESSRIEGWRQHVVGKQKYPFELTLKEAGQ